MGNTISKKFFFEFSRTVKENPHRYLYIKNNLMRFKKEGFDINTKNPNGKTLLHMAVKLNEIKLCKLLCKLGVIIDLADELGTTPLHQAVSENKIQIVKTLITAGADVNLGAEQDQTPLHLAVINGNLDIVKYLVNNKADICLVDEKNFDSIDYAVDERDQTILNYFSTKVEISKRRLEEIERITKGEDYER